MKKLRILLFIFSFVIFPFLCLKVKANDDEEYLSYSEIIMATGKLAKDFTEYDYQQFDKLNLSKMNIMGMLDIIYAPVNESIPASYISSTTFSVDNNGGTDIVYEVDVTLETNLKTSFSSSGSINASIGSTVKKLKGEIGGKFGVDTSTTSTISKKEKKSMKLIVEANSRAIIYVTGECYVTNIFVALEIEGTRYTNGAFEYVVLSSQYARIEKDTIWGN